MKSPTSRSSSTPLSLAEITGKLAGTQLEARSSRKFVVQTRVNLPSFFFSYPTGLFSSPAIVVVEKNTRGDLATRVDGATFYSSHLLERSVKEARAGGLLLMQFAAAVENGSKLKSTRTEGVRHARTHRRWDVLLCFQRGDSAKAVTSCSTIKKKVCSLLYIFLPTATTIVTLLSTAGRLTYLEIYRNVSPLDHLRK